MKKNWTGKSMYVALAAGLILLYNINCKVSELTAVIQMHFGPGPNDDPQEE